MSSESEVIETTVSRVGAELARRGLDPDDRVTITIEPDELIPGRRASRARVIAAGLTDDDIDHLNGLAISGGRIENIRCYLTGQSLGGGRYMVNRYHIRDKHDTTRIVYNAKINIHRENTEPIFLGIQRDDLWAFATAKVETLNRDAEQTGSYFIRP